MPLLHNGSPISNFVIRYQGAGESLAARVAEYAGTPADMIIMEAAYEYTTPGSDTRFSNADVNAIRNGGDGRLAIAYMSVGTIDVRRDQYTSNVAAQVARDGSGNPIFRPSNDVNVTSSEVYLRFWDDTGTGAANQALLQHYESWLIQQFNSGYDGVFLDVIDAYNAGGAVGADIPGANASQDAHIGARAILTIIRHLADVVADLEAQSGREFRIVLGHDPYLISNYRNGQRPAGYPAIDETLIDAVQAAVDGVLVENDQAFRNLDFVSPTGITNEIIGLFNNPDIGFGTATRLATSYAEPNRLDYEFIGGKLGWLSYTTPTNPEPFSTTHYPLFNHADANANALVGNGFGNLINGLAGDDKIAGLNGNDTLIGGQGNDRLEGGQGNDVYHVEGMMDTVVELASQGFDTIISEGSFSIVTLASIERVELTGSIPGFLRGNSGNNSLIGNAGSNPIEGNAGDDVLLGLGGRDTLTGGLGRDTIAPGLERDTVRWNSVAESTGTNRDAVSEFVFASGGPYESLDFPFIPSQLRPTITTGSLSEATFDIDLQNAVTAARLGVGQAVLFDPNGGDLNVAGQVFLIVDANGVAGYQANQDYVVQFTSSYGQLTLANFI